MGNIERLKMEQIEATATRIEEIIEAATNSGFSLKEKLSFLLRVQPITQNLFKMVDDTTNKTKIETLLQSEKRAFLGLIYRVQHLAEQYDLLIKRTRTLLELAGSKADGDTKQRESLNQNTPRKAGRPKADSQKELNYYLKNCDTNNIITALKNDTTNKKTYVYYGCILLTLQELGLIDFSDIDRKSVIYAMNNTLKCGCSLDNIQKILRYGYEEEEREKHKATIEAIKALLQPYINSMDE